MKKGIFMILLLGLTLVVALQPLAFVSAETNNTESSKIVGSSMYIGTKGADFIKLPIDSYINIDKHSLTLRISLHGSTISYIGNFLIEKVYRSSYYKNALYLDTKITSGNIKIIQFNIFKNGSALIVATTTDYKVSSEKKIFLVNCIISSETMKNDFLELFDRVTIDKISIKDELWISKVLAPTQIGEKKETDSKLLSLASTFPTSYREWTYYVRYDFLWYWIKYYIVVRLQISASDSEISDGSHTHVIVKVIDYSEYARDSNGNYWNQDNGFYIGQAGYYIGETIVEVKTNDYIISIGPPIRGFYMYFWETDSYGGSKSLSGIYLSVGLGVAPGGFGGFSFGFYTSIQFLNNPSVDIYQQDDYLYTKYVATKWHLYYANVPGDYLWVRWTMHCSEEIDSLGDGYITISANMAHLEVWYSTPNENYRVATITSGTTSIGISINND